MKRTLITLAIALAVCLNLKASVLVTIGSGGYSGALSDSSPIPEGFTFALGSFGGFTPTSLNLNLWAANFTPLSTGSWSAFDDFDFNGNVGDFNPAPFTAGSQAYLWGYNSQTFVSTSQWVLFVNPSWTWPVSGGSPGTPVFWTLGDSGPTTTIYGSVDNSGYSFQTAAVPEPGTVTLFGLAAMGYLWFVRRRRVA